MRGKAEIIQEAVRKNASKPKKRKIGYEKLYPYTIKTIEFLVQCANERKPTDYASVSKQIGINNIRWANVAFGAIAEVLMAISPEFPDVPDLTAIVTHSHRPTSGEGALQGKFPSASASELKELLRIEREKVFSYPAWNDVLELLALKPSY